MAGFHTRIRVSGYPFAETQIGVKLAAGITPAHIGRAVTQDTSADNQVKLAGDGDEIIGRIFSVEDRSGPEGQLIGTIEFNFAAKLPIKAGLAGAAQVTRGKRLIGAGDGEVKAIDLGADPAPALIAAYAAAPRVWEVSDNGTVAHATLVA